jgi:protein-S-isoprenylcysteine O-methyltransferase Ste14
MSARSAIRRASTLAIGTGLAVLGWTATATGCPVCFAADERTRASFLGTAVFLSALPLGLFAALAFWFWRELGRADGPPERDVTTARTDAQR